MISTENKDGKLDITLAQSLDISYLSHTTGVLYEGKYNEEEIKKLHPVFGIFRNVFDDCVNRNEHKLDVKEDKITISYTTQVHGNTIAFDLVALCKHQEGTDQDVVNLQRQNRVLANKVVELENETTTLKTKVSILENKVDILENKVDILIRNFASHVWAGHGILTDPDSKRPDALNKLFNIRDTTIDNKNKTIYTYLTSNDEKKIRRGIALQGDANIFDPDGNYYALHRYTSSTLNRDIVKLLVDNKADINKKGGICSGFDGKTPLEYKIDIANGHKEQVRIYQSDRNGLYNYTHYKKQLDDTEDEIKFLKSLGATE